MNIPTPCALKASFQIFGRGMRTHTHEGRERSVVKLRCLLNAYQSRSGYVRRVRFLVRVHQKEKEKAGRLSCGYGNLLCGEKVTLNVPHILSRCASRRTTQDALAERAYANPAASPPCEIPRTGHQKNKKWTPKLVSIFYGDSYGNRTHVFSVRG